MSGTPDSDGFSGSVSGGATVAFTGVNTLTGGGNSGDSLTGLNTNVHLDLGHQRQLSQQQPDLVFLQP